MAHQWEPSFKAGSSPLARGLPSAATEVLGESRIIPARAGFTSVVFSIVDNKADHPRSRGVYAAARRSGRPAAGSSPLARGLPDGRQNGRYVGGIIPARAGFTSRRAPRPEFDGSSPLARGLHPDFDQPADLAADHPRSRGVYAPGPSSGVVIPGIIPARAGFTPNG